MKITRKQLKRLIREELQNVLEKELLQGYWEGPLEE
jgi:hypothetical protein